MHKYWITIHKIYRIEINCQFSEACKYLNPSVSLVSNFLYLIKTFRRKETFLLTNTCLFKTNKRMNPHFCRIRCLTAHVSRLTFLLIISKSANALKNHDLSCTFIFPFFKGGGAFNASSWVFSLSFIKSELKSNNFVKQARLHFTAMCTFPTWKESCKSLLIQYLQYLYHIFWLRWLDSYSHFKTTCNYINLLSKKNIIIFFITNFIHDFQNHV